MDDLKISDMNNINHELDLIKSMNMLTKEMQIKRADLIAEIRAMQGNQKAKESDFERLLEQQQVLSQEIRDTQEKTKELDKVIPILALNHQLILKQKKEIQNELEQLEQSTKDLEKKKNEQQLIKTQVLEQSLNPGKDFIELDSEVNKEKLKQKNNEKDLQGMKDEIYHMNQIASIFKKEVGPSTPYKNDIRAAEKEIKYAQDILDRLSNRNQTQNRSQYTKRSKNADNQSILSQTQRSYTSQTSRRSNYKDSTKKDKTQPEKIEKKNKVKTNEQNEKKQEGKEKEAKTTKIDDYTSSPKIDPSSPNKSDKLSLSNPQSHLIPPSSAYEEQVKNKEKDQNEEFDSEFEMDSGLWSIDMDGDVIQQTPGQGGSDAGQLGIENSDKKKRKKKAKKQKTIKS